MSDIKVTKSLAPTSVVQEQILNRILTEKKDQYFQYGIEVDYRTNVVLPPLMKELKSKKKGKKVGKVEVDQTLADIEKMKEAMSTLEIFIRYIEEKLS